MRSAVVKIILYIEALLSPLIYLWPWTIATAIYAAFIQSPQGIVLLDATKRNPPHWAVTVACIGVSVFLIVSSVTLTGLIYIWSRHSKNWHHLTIGQRTGFPLGVLLALVLFLGPVTMLVFKARLTVAAVFLVALCVIFIALAIFVLVAPLLSGPEESTPVLNFVIGHRSTLVLFGTLASTLPIVLGAQFVVNSPLQLGKVGPLLLVLLGLCALAGLAQGLLVSIPHALGLPFVGVIFAVALMAWYANAPFRTDGANPLLEPRVRNLRTSASLDEAHCRQLDPHRSVGSRVQAPPDTPLVVAPPGIYLVSSEGGGIRAAYWTAVGLAQLDLGSNGQFASEVASLSGVSGGSLGIATWLAARELPGIDDARRLALVKEYLSGDFLTPMLGGLLFLDAPRLLLGRLWFHANRGQVFENSLALRWEALTGSDFFFRPINNLCLRSFVNPPLIYINATDAVTGSNVAIGNSWSPTRKRDRLFGPSAIADSHSGVSVAQAVHISAHFPFLSPADDVSISAQWLAIENIIEHEDGSPGDDNRRIADRLRAPYEQARGAVLVDGGYYDDTGLTASEALLDILREKLQGEARRYASVNLLHFENDPEKACFPVAKDWRAFATAPVLSYIDAAGFTPQCAQEIALLERATLPRRFEFLNTHLLAIHSVRGEHARERRKALESHLDLGNGSRANLLRMDVSSEIDCAFRTTECSRGSNFDSLDVRRPEEVERRYSLALTRNEDLLMGNWYASPDAFKRHRARIEAWRRAALAIGSALDCAGQKPRSPPLAWTLGAEDRLFLDCLAFRAAVAKGFPATTPPGMQVNEVQIPR